MSSKKSFRTIASGGVIYFAANVINACVPFLLLPILSRMLTTSEFGQVTMFQTVVSALGAFVGMNCAPAVVRRSYEVRTPGELSGYFSAATLVLFTSGGFFFVLILFSYGYLSEILKVPFSWLFLSVVVAMSNVVIAIRLGLWQAQRQSKKYGFFQSVQAIFNMGLSLWVIVILSFGGPGRVWAIVIAGVVFSAISIFLLKKDGYASAPSFSLGNIKSILAYGVPLIPHVAGIFLLNFFDRILITNSIGLEATALYSVAYQISAVLAIVFDAINKAYSPWLFEQLSKDVGEDIKRNVVKVIYSAFIAVSLIAAALYGVSGFVVEFVAGSKYSKATEVLGWLIGGQAFAGMYLFVTAIVFFSKRTGLLSSLTVFCGVINVALLVLLVELNGLKGAAQAFCIAMAIRFIGTWWLSLKVYALPWTLAKK